MTSELDELNARLAEGGWCWYGLYHIENVLFYRIWRRGLFGFTKYQIDVSRSVLGHA